MPPLRSLLLAAGRSRAQQDRFCLGGISTTHGPYRICCPAQCGACVEDDKCRARPPGGLVCCPCRVSSRESTAVQPAQGRRLLRARRRPGVLPLVSRGCRACGKPSRLHLLMAPTRGRALELKETGLQTFQAGPKKHAENVHVAVAADRAHYVGLIACVGSVFAAARDPSAPRLGDHSGARRARRHGPEARAEVSSTGPRGRRRVRRAAILKARRGPRAAGPGLRQFKERGELRALLFGCVAAGRGARRLPGRGCTSSQSQPALRR